MNATETYREGEWTFGGDQLQWGRRVNATETDVPVTEALGGDVASMGPSRECDGDKLTELVETLRGKLQWGRRVNATETMRAGRSGVARIWRFNGAVA